MIPSTICPVTSPIDDSEIGTVIMNQLKKHDKVAYVRFASVYMDFKDVKEFMAELKHLLDAKENPAPKVKTGAKA